MSIYTFYVTDCNFDENKSVTIVWFIKVRVAVFQNFFLIGVTRNISRNIMWDENIFYIPN